MGVCQVGLNLFLVEDFLQSFLNFVDEGLKFAYHFSCLVKFGVILFVVGRLGGNINILLKRLDVVEFDETFLFGRVDFGQRSIIFVPALADDL